MIRRAITTLFAVTAFAAATLAGIRAADAPDVVTVEGGRVSGTVLDGVASYRGIPYAAPPTGALRWKPPLPAPAWNGVRDGSQYGPECMQSQYGQGSVYIRPMRPLSEDCLTLNVWTTAKRGERLPVWVWVHGGALTRGSGTSDIRDGSPVARKGVVLVSMNYRLGAFGYLAHPELTAESPQHSAGNYGVLDQIAALQWVQRNIAQFGGDLSRVTIGGESAGSWSVNTLVASPLAKGLFIRAIGESGGRFTGTPHLHDDRPGMTSAETVGMATAKALGAADLKALRALPAERLIDAPSFRTQENVDGWVLPDEHRVIFAAGRQNRGAVLVGSNKDEWTSLGGARGGPATLDDLRKRTAMLYGPLAPEFESAYSVRSDADVPAAWLSSNRDTVFSMQMRAWARATVSAGDAAYLYFFSHVPPSPRRQELRAFHASELPYVFNVLTFGDPREAGFGWTSVDERLADQMSTYWTNFVKTGSPNGAALLNWPAYTRQDERYLELADTVRPGQHLLQAELDFQDKAAARSPR